MLIEKLNLSQEIVKECVVVIDVLRAFTTAAYAFSQGAKKIITVSTLEEAFALKQKHPEYLLIGEMQAKKVPGFDFGNSPAEIKTADLKGCTLVQRTSSGTQGIAKSLPSKKILVSSFVVAEATLQRLMQLNPSQVSFLITGRSSGDEDLALADYLGEKIQKQESIDPQPFLQRVMSSPTGRLYATAKDFAESDLECALTLDIFPFALEMFMEEGLPVMYPVNAKGLKQV